MFEELFKKISERSPLCLLILCIIAGTFYVTNRYHHWRNRVVKAEDECKKIEAQLQPQLNEINNNINSLNNNVNNLVVYLRGKDNNMDTHLFVSKSPIQLTDLGNKILKDIGGKIFIDNNLDELLREMDQHEIRSALDSQIFAPIVIANVSTKDSFKNIKDYIYKTPFYTVDKYQDTADYTVSLDMGTVANIMGIYLRDKYLEKNIHLNPEDINRESNG